MTKTNLAPMLQPKKFQWQKFLLVCFLGIATGIFLGSWYSYTMLTANVDYSIYSEEKLREDESYKDIISSVLKISNPTEAQCENFVELFKERNIKPSNLLPSQNFILAEYNATLANSFKAIGSGLVETIATQSIYSEKLFDGNAYTFSSISAGLLTVADCSYMEKGSESVSSHKGNNVTSTSAEWTGAVTNYSKQDYKDIAGNTPDVLKPYIVTSKTILVNRSEDISFENYNEKQVYKFSFQLDPVKSVLNYVKQVRLTSGLSGYPTFDDVTYTVLMDENWNFVRTEVVENYRIPYGGLQPKCKGTLNTNYEFNIPVNLPINKG